MMYHGKHEAPKSAARHSFKKAGVLLAALVLIVSTVVGGTLAYLATQTGPVVNTFTPGKVDVEIEEDFKDNVKSNVYITNVQSADSVTAYIRAKVVVTWRDADNNIVQQPDGYTLNLTKPADFDTNWFENGGIYYHKAPVDPGKQTAMLIEKASYTVAAGAEPGYHLDIQIIAEGIQAKPTTGVTEKWHVNVGTDGNLVAPQA